MQIGNRAVPGQQVYIGSAIGNISYGELVALAGDYFESMSQLQNLANDPLYGRDEVLFALWKVNPSRPRPLVGRNVEAAVMDRYYQLAGRNETHFSTGSAPGRSNREQYIAMHTSALQEAYSKGRTGIIHSPNWEAREAFSNHFLTDAFSGGHIRTPRGDIQRHWNGLYPNFTDNLVSLISCYMASYINDRDNIGYVASVGQLANGIAPILRAQAGNVLSAFSIGDLISKVLHDQDNAGLDVVSQASSSSSGVHQWRAVGDDFLFSVPPGVTLTPALAQAQQETQRMVMEAVRLSFAEAQQAHAAGASGNPALATLTNPSQYQALALLPSADSASTLNPAQDWRAANIRAMSASLQTLLVAAFAPGTEVRQGLDGVAVDCITTINRAGIDFDLHTRDAFLCFKQQFLANIFAMMIRAAEGTTLCPAGNNNPCPTLRNPCP